MSMMLRLTVMDHHGIQPFKYLQDALSIAAESEIWVAEGVYKPDRGAGVTAR